MATHKRIVTVISIATLILLGTGLLLDSFAIFAQNPVTQDTQPIITLNESRNMAIVGPLTDPEPLGLPCGSGELLPEWVICLHGTIYLLPADGGLPQPLTGVTITASYADHIVSGTTFIHPGEITPTFGIDISSLEPTYLEPITITVTINGQNIVRHIPVFPNLNNHNQHYDLFIPEVGALDPAPFWGYVVDHASGGPVANASIKVTTASQLLVVTSTQTSTDSLPIYTISADDLAFLGVMPGDNITFTATFNGETDQQVVQWNGEETQLNFVTGWKCKDFDPLPRSSGGFGLPRSSGGFGLPDVACIVGHALVDGVTTSGF